MTEREPWLGHHDLCSIQWSSICDCDPDGPIDFSTDPDLYAPPGQSKYDPEQASDG